MTFAEALDLVALPCSIVLTAGFSWVAARAAAYLRESTHAVRLTRLVDGAVRTANDISDRLKELPAGADLATVKAEMIQTGITDARKTFDSTIAKLGGASDAEVEKLIRAGFTPPVSLVAPVVAIPAAVLTEAGLVEQQPLPGTA